MYKASENYTDLIDANLADVLVEPFIRAVNIARLTDMPLRDSSKAEQRYQFIRDARERGSQG